MPWEKWKMTHVTLEDVLGDVISSYSRKQAIEDGVLGDVSEVAREAGFKFPVAISTGVTDLVSPSEDLIARGQSFQGRLWDVLQVLCWKIKLARDGGSYLKFAVKFLCDDGRYRNIVLKSICGPGDSFEPVITILLENED